MANDWLETDDKIVNSDVRVRQGRKWRRGVVVGRSGRHPNRVIVWLDGDDDFVAVAERSPRIRWIVSGSGAGSPKRMA